VVVGLLVGVGLIACGDDGGTKSQGGEIAADGAVDTSTPVTAAPTTATTEDPALAACAAQVAALSQDMDTSEAKRKELLGTFIAATQKKLQVLDNLPSNDPDTAIAQLRQLELDLTKLLPSTVVVRDWVTDARRIVERARRLAAESCSQGPEFVPAIDEYEGLVDDLESSAEMVYAPI
jgi:hypothetical protein